MKHMRTLKSAALALALTALGVAGAAAAEFEFKMHHLLSGKSPAHTGMLAPWAEQVAKNSGGRVHIEIYPSMTLGGKPPELVQQARDGVVDLIWTVNGYTPGLFPRTEVFELPTVFTNNITATNLAMYDMFEDTLRQEYKGLEVMFLHVHGGQAIHMREKEVRKPSDLKGLILRIPNRTGVMVIEALGAIPKGMPVPALPEALQKGTVDGALIPWEIIPPLGIHKNTKFQIEGHNKARLGTTTFQVSMNKGRWEDLPDDIKKAFKDASTPEWLETIGKLWRAGDDHGIKVAVDSGNTHITLTEEETAAFDKALEPVVQRWIDDVTSNNGIDGAALVKRARELIAKHSKM